MLITVTNSDTTTSTYPIVSAAAISGGYRVTISRPNASNRSQNDGLEKAVADNAAVSFYLRSQIASSGHTMEYVGSGMDYDALPENGGVPDETKQITELNNGKVWTAITDHNGKFKIGGNQTDDPIFEVDQQLGFITIPTGSIAFDLLSDTTPQLGGDLDVNGQSLVSTNDGNITGVARMERVKLYVTKAITTSGTNSNIALAPTGTGTVDVSTSRITGVSTPNAASDAATKGYVDTQVGAISGSTNLSYDAGTRVIASDTGNDATLPLATTSDAGLLSSADKTKLNGLSQSSTSANNTSVTTVDNGVNSGYVDIITDNSLQARFGSGTSTFSSHIKLDNPKRTWYFEDTSNGSNYLAFKAPASVTSSVTFTLPDGDGSADQVIKTDGNGTLAWADQSGGGGATGGGTDKVFQEKNKLTVDSNYTIGTNIGGSGSVGTGASCVGPITVASGITLTVPANARLVVL